MEDLGKTLFKHPCGLYVHYNDEWTNQHFGHDSLGKGDIIYNTCKKIIDDNDLSDWAYDALEIVTDLLIKGKRWPDEFNSFLDARSWVQYQLSYIRFRIIYLFKKPYPVFRLYRTQRSMTRDPIILQACLAVHLNAIQFIEVVKPPIRLFRLNTWLWRKSLITGKRSKVYELLERSNNKRDYVQLMKHYRLQAYWRRVNN